MKKNWMILVSTALLFSLAPGLFASEVSAQELDLSARITQVDTENFPEVVVYVSVVDQIGEPAGIEPDQLVLTENGEQIFPESIQGIGDASPITTLLLIDISGSMNVDNKLDAARAAALSYVDATRDVDRIGLIAFNTQVSVVQEITVDKELVREGIQSLEGIYDTAMLDALQQGLVILRGEQGRKAIIVLTDGLDNQSQTTLDDLLLALEPQDVSISTIGFGNREHDQTAMSAVNEEMLQQIADTGGGLYSYAADEQALQEIYDLYGRALQSEYVIRYLSPSSLRDGVNRSIQVNLVDPMESMGASAGDGSSLEETVYNPGGVVPESAGMAPWPFFFMLLAPLLVLLILPGLFGLVKRLLFRGSSGKKSNKSSSKGRIKLH